MFSITSSLIRKNPKHIYVSAWSVVNQQAGDVFRSHDGGNNWEALPGVHGKSVRAMAIAPYDSKVLVIGALDGVFRSKNGGNSWERISPAAQAELKNVESIAVDPKNPDVVYAGTWHLAWKTDDSGASWHRINKGMIDDSDVFSVIVDSTNPAVVYASACSGIYKSDSAGDLFRKMQGIPFSARRTRVLKQDPNNPGTVYAGTTEGLWKTADAGKTWKRVSNPEVVVNDVLVDPRNSNRVLLATDRSGVLASDNGAQTFVASNHGYVHRYVSSILADKNDPNSIQVGVVNDREFGGVFSTRDGGQSWQQKSAGLGGRDVFALQQTSTGGPDCRHQQGHLPARSQCQPVASDQHHRDREVSGASGERQEGQEGGKSARGRGSLSSGCARKRYRSHPQALARSHLLWTVYQLRPGQDLDRRSGDGQE